LPEKLANFYYRLFARKVNKISEFHMTFGTNVRILRNNCPKNIFPDFFRGGGCRLPPSPTPMEMHYIDTRRTMRQIAQANRISRLFVTHCSFIREAAVQ